jgi:hypothetical protein
MSSKSMDPRDLFADEPLTQFKSIEVGDWIKAASWRRPRLVVAMERGIYVVLAEPDPSRQDQHQCRRVSADEFAERTWRTCPNMREVWSQFR